MDIRPLLRRAEMLYFRTRLSRLFAELMSRNARHLYELGIRDVGDLPKGSRIADIGCGHGTFLCMYLSRYPEVSGFGLDQSAELLKFAHRQCGKAGVQADFRTGDIHSAKLPDNAFDVVVSHSSIYCWKDPVRALDRIYPALKTGGRLLVYDELPVRSFRELRHALFVQRVYGLGMPAYTEAELCGFILRSRFTGYKKRIHRLIILLEMHKTIDTG
jgi:ubiquinone/menaquinone biosynthesis C-methylase UbiE